MVAGHLTEGWTQSVWKGVEQLLAGGIPSSARPRREAPQRARQRQNRLSAAQVADLVADYEAGLSIQKLAAKYKIRHETVARWLKRSGIEQRPLKIGIPRDRLAEALGLRKDGWSYARIGKRFGCSGTAVSSALRKYEEGWAAEDLDSSPLA